MILVTGAGGKTGRAVTAQLSRGHQTVRALIFHAAHAEESLHAGASEVVCGDMRDTTVLQTAVSGCESVYHICSNMNPDEVLIGQNIIDACRHAGVRRFVFHSVLHSQVESMPHHWLKLRVEELLFESGLLFTILQPTAYMQNILAYREIIINRKKYPVPYSAETRLSMVDLDDVAEAAARIIINPGHENAIYELVGESPLSQIEVAHLLSKVVGDEVMVDQIPLKKWETEARTGGMEEYAIRTLLKMFLYYEKFGFCGNPNVLTWLLGRKPNSLEEFLKQNLKQPN